MFYFIALLLAASTLLALLKPVIWHKAETDFDVAHSDAQFYQKQLEDLAAQYSSAGISKADMKAAEGYIGRNLLDAQKRIQQTSAEVSGNRSILSILLALVIFGGATLTYVALGTSGAKDTPMAQRLAELEAARQTRPSQAEAEASALPRLPSVAPPAKNYLELITKLRSIVENRPNDIQGLRLLAQHEMQLGNFELARLAQSQLVNVQGEMVETSDVTRLFEIMVYNTDGYISPEAEAVLDQLLRVEPAILNAQFFKGLLEIQNGRPDLAFPVWRNLLAVSPPNAPWVDQVRDQLPRVAAAAGVRYDPEEIQTSQSGPTQSDIAAAAEMSAEDRMEMIRGMVSGLSQRLADEGGPVEDWVKLIRALVVLKDIDRAKGIHEEALSVFAQSPSDLQALRASADELGLN